MSRSKKKGIAHPDDPVAGALDQAAKFCRVMARAGAPLSAFTPALQDLATREHLVEYVNLGFPKVNSQSTIITTPAGYELARAILGPDFITPQEVTRARDLVYSAGQLVSLVRSLPSVETLAWCRANGFVLLPAPPKALCLLDTQGTIWLNLNEVRPYAREKPRFATREFTPEAIWMAMRKEEVPGSLNHTWPDQLALLSAKERVPNFVELSWLVTTYWLARGVLLLTKFVPYGKADHWLYIRSSSGYDGKIEDGETIVAAGHPLPEEGIEDLTFNPDIEVEYVGLASALKL